MNIPAGFCIRTELGHFYTRTKDRLTIPTRRVLKSWNFNILKVREEDVTLPIKGTLGFRNGTAIENIADGKKYVVSNNKLLLITDPDVIKPLRLKFIVVSQREIDLHDIGGELSGS